MSLASPSLRVVIQRHTDSTAVVAVILANNLLGVQLPQPRVVVGASSHKICRVGAEGAVPDPALVAGEGGLERVGFRLLVGSRLHVFHLPDLGGMVGTAGGKLLDIW
jgi:hypothetical protein